MDANAITMIPAPAIPISTRAAMNCPGVVEYAQATEPSPNRTRATSMVRRWPNRSPTTPAGSIPAASTSR